MTATPMNALQLDENTLAHFIIVSERTIEVITLTIYAYLRGDHNARNNVDGIME